MNYEAIYHWLGVIVVAAPAFLAALLGLSSLLELPLPERTIGRLTKLSVITGLFASIGILGLMLVLGSRNVPVEVGHWVEIPHFHFEIKFVFDRLSVPFVILSFLLCGTIGAFADVYLHRESGFNRFFFLYAIFLLGMVVASLAGTIETLFAGWELVGLSSALLVAFFHERPGPVRNGLHVWSVYRVADAALLLAAVALHHMTGEGDFDVLMGAGSWPDRHAPLTAWQAFSVGSLLLIAAAGKSALVPFSGWLPRAMEGPTPSSAIFYGSLSVHLGAYLLLRVSPILEQSFALSAMVVGLGLITAVFAAIAGRVQTDIKSALSFACMTQLGIIVIEIGFGFRYLALIHIIGHACFRTLQFLRAPTLLRDYHSLENAIGGRLSPQASLREGWIPRPLYGWLYRLALERGYLDAWLMTLVVRPVLQVFEFCNSLERKWTDFLAGGTSRESDSISPNPAAWEELQ